MHLGEVVPDFSAISTKGAIDFYNWAGESWCILFGHPSNFFQSNPVELYKLVYECEKRNIKLLGITWNELKNHVDWINNFNSYCLIKKKFSYPIISDINVDIARTLAVELGMITELYKENWVTAKLIVKSLYLIGPNKEVKHMMLYPNKTGRNVKIILSYIDSVRLRDEQNSVATTVNRLTKKNLMMLPMTNDQTLTKARQCLLL